MPIKPTTKRKIKIIVVTAGAIFSLYIVIALILVSWFKSDIESHFLAELNKKINGTARISAFKVNILNDFPNASIKAENIKVCGLDTSGTTKEIIDIEKIHLHITLYKLIAGKVELKKISIENAKIYITRLQTGDLNTAHLLIPSGETNPDKSGSDFSKMDISIHNARMVYEDTIVACNFFDITIKDADVTITQTPTGFNLQCKNVLQSQQLVFNKDKGPLLENQTLKMHFLVNWNQVTKRYTLLPSRVINNHSTFYLHGALHLKDKPELTIYIGNPEILFNEATALTTAYARENLSGYNFERPLSMHLYVHGELIPNNPINHDIYFYTSKNNFQLKESKLLEAAITGHYTNHQNDTLYNDESNAGMYISKLNGFYEGIPVAAQFKVINFKNPLIEFRLTCDTRLSKLNNIIDTSTIRFNKGVMKLDMTLTGFLNKKQQTLTDSISMISGSLELVNADYTVTKPQYHFEQITGKMRFEQGNLLFFKLPVTINKNKTHISGIFKDFSNSIFNPAIPLQAELSVSTSNFNINNFKQPTTEEKPIQKVNPINKTTKSILANIQAHITLESDTLVYKKLIMRNTTGTFLFKNNSIYCESAEAEVSGGKALISGNLNNLGASQMPYTMDIRLNNIDIEKIFTGLNNFNQQTITSEVIDGKVTASIQLTGTLNKSYLPELSSLNGKAAIRINNGALHGLKAITDISSVIFKNRDLSEINFATITHSSNIVSGEIIIDEMSIQSSLLIFAIAGTYSFGNNTSLLVKVPLKSITNPDKKYLESNIVNDDKTGLSLLFKITKTDGDLQINPILFQRKNVKKQE